MGCPVCWHWQRSGEEVEYAIEAVSQCGYSREVALQGATREYARLLAGLIDGSLPVGTNAVGRCPHCPEHARCRVRCHVFEVSAGVRTPSPC